jgi:hypothetical protein
MSNALIGHTGFVGSTLARARVYDAAYNSKNIQEIDGRVFDTVICAGASASKWLANQEPEADLREINRLISHLDRAKAGRFVLISTIDVYRVPVNVDEGDVPQREGLHAYGLHRLMLEDYVRERFASAVVIRLPGLFGEGLRKNLIFDMMNRKQTGKISPMGMLQWYAMRRFPMDMDTILASGVRLINLAVEPVSTGEIWRRFFPTVAIGAATTAGPHYDMNTQFAEVLGGQGRYHMDIAAMLHELAHFVHAEQRRA